MIPVILSGGSGTRLWPVSRVKLPKQFCELFDESLQTLSLKRASRLGSPIVLTSKELKSLTQQNIKTLKQEVATEVYALYEPFPKNTAPALAYLCKNLLLQNKNEEVVAIFPSDHLIEKEEIFIETIRLAAKVAQDNYIVTLGIKPDFPATGYGYIEIENTPSAQRLDNKNDAKSVLKFYEKPNIDRAQEFLKKGNYFWNAGIFIFKVETMVELFKKWTPEIWQQFDKLTQQNLDDPKQIEAIYNFVPNISIDYAIMEKLTSSELKCLPCDIGWNDVGSWDAVSSLFKNIDTDFVPVEILSNNNYIHGLKKKVYACIGIEDTIVVDTADALLISKKGLSQNVKDVVDTLKKTNHKSILEHTFEDRPWGRYEVIRESSNFKTKVIHVQPGQQLSYQSHTKREEHWIITSGSGAVIIDEKETSIQTGSYIKVPQNAKHRIRNTGTDVLEFVEVQLGSYLGEDDITRYQDDYKRD